MGLRGKLKLQLTVRFPHFGFVRAHFVPVNSQASFRLARNLLDSDISIFRTGLSAVQTAVEPLKAALCAAVPKSAPQ
jgi:hypothetical protein